MKLWPSPRRARSERRTPTGRQDQRRRTLQAVEIEQLEPRILLAGDLGRDPKPFAPVSIPGEIMLGLRSADGIDNIQTYLSQQPWGARLNELAADVDVIFNLAETGGTKMAVTHVLLAEGVDADAAIGELQGLVNVVYAEPNRAIANALEFVPNDPEFVNQYHHAVMENIEAWDTTLGDPNIVVGITDTGVDWDHPDLAANIFRNTGEIPGNGVDDDGNGYIDDVRGWDCASNDNNPDDPDDHGTHVAGIAAGRTDNGVGISGTSGGSTIMPLRISSFPSTAIYACAFSYAADNGANIVNTSFNIDGYVGDSTFAASLQYLYDNEVLHFNSAGNNGQNNPPRQVFDQSLFVASTDAADVRSGFSNYGRGIDLAAPGSDILSTLPGTYGVFSGTSMAAPNAAGVAALIWSAHPDWTRDQVAAQIVGTADNIALDNLTDAGVHGDVGMGTGRVNSARGVSELLTGPRISYLRELPLGENPEVTPLSTLTADILNVFEKSTVEEIGNWELRSDGIDNTFDTADDVFIPLTLVTDNYMIGTNEIVFDFPVLAEDQYRFTAVSGGLTDPFGNPLDGNRDGNAGDDYVQLFQVVAGGGGGGGNCGDPDAFGYQACALPTFEFEDISGTGNVISFSNNDDGTSLITPAGFSFDFYGTTYTNLNVNTNGNITFGSGYTGFTNTDLTTTPTQPTIAPYFDDLWTDTGSARVFWQTLGSGADERLIVQWNTVEYYIGSAADTITFQAVLYEADGRIQFNYLDLVGSVSSDNGASATVGIKDAGTQGGNRNVPSFNMGPNEWVDTGLSTEFRLDAARCTDPDAFGYQACTTPSFEFEDISGTGTVITSLTGGDDASATITPGFDFSFYGVDYASYNISTNGTISLGGTNSSFSNTDLTSSPSAATIAPFWDDLHMGTGQAYYQVLGSGDSERLVIQWNEIRFFGGSTTDPITFQAVLSADGTIQLNYLDLVNGTSVRNNGASATVGIKDAGVQGGNRTLAAFNDGPNDYVGTGLSTVIGIFNNTPPSVLRLDREMVRQYEGNAGDTTVYDYTVTRLSELDNAATVDFQVIGAGLFPADGDDFVGGVLPSGTVTFAPGEVTQTISISVAGDDDLEIDERFTVVLSNPTLAVLQNTTAYGLIRNEDRVIVTNVNDSGPGSLRNAIDLTNAVNGSPTIYFEIPGDDFHVISPITPLPAVTNGAILDASLQEGYDGTPRVILSGDQLGPGDHGLVLAGEKALVKGFAFVDFGGFGVVAAGDGGHKLLENEYGLIFGTDPRGNGGGAHLMSPDNTVDDSLLVDMHGPAIVIDGEDSDGNRVRNNLFGLTDTAVMPLHGDAIIVTDADAAEISFNTISGNPGDAIVLGGDDHHVEGNTIGLALDGARLSNLGSGIQILDGSNSMVLDNTISYNFGYGVQIHPTAGVGNVLRGNVLLNNTRMGIDIGPAGPNANDGLDPDSGANGLQNSPVVDSALLNLAAGTMRVTGTIQTTPDTEVEIEFFGTPLSGTGGVGDSAEVLGLTTIITNSVGVGVFDAVVAAGSTLTGQLVTATATTLDGTSEFSQGVVVANANRTPYVVVHDASVVEADDFSVGLRFEIELSQAYTDIVQVEYRTLPGTAIAASDYEAQTGRVTFAPGQTSRFVTVVVFGDVETETLETMSLELTGVTNGTLLRDAATGLIFDNDHGVNARPLGASNRDNSEYMLGEILVNVVVLESYGPDELETWTPQNLEQVTSAVDQGLQWWEDLFALQGSPHYMNLDVRTDLAGGQIAIPVEPTSYATSDAALWLDPVLDHFGANTAASAVEDMDRFNDVLRSNGADWAVTVLVINNTGLERSFVDGLKSYGAFDGSFVTILGDASPAEVAAAFGQAFYALDEGPTGASVTASSGYYNTPNSNGLVDNPVPGSRVPSIMAESPLREIAFNTLTSSPESLAAIGWQDSDGDGIFDVLDVPLALSGQGTLDEATRMYTFVGESSAVPLDNLNPFGSGNDVTINRVRELQYRLDGGPWITVDTFNSNSVSISSEFGPLDPFTLMELRTFDTQSGVPSNVIVNNAPPTLDDLPNLTINEDAPLQTVNFTGVTAGASESQPLKVSATSSNPALIAAPAVEYVSPETSGALKFAPSLNQFGSAVITVTVTDAGVDGDFGTDYDNVSLSKEFTVTVTSVNDNPTMTPIDDVTFDEDTSSGPLAFTIGDVESPLQQLVVSATSDNQELIRNTDLTLSGLGAERTIKVSARPNVSGTATITVLVRDPDGGQGQQQFLVTVDPVNDLPTISSIPNVTTAEDFPTALLSFTVGDIETPPEDLQLTVSTSDPDLLPVDGVAIQGTGARRTVRVTPGANQTGVGTVTLTVTDADGASTNKSFQVTVTPINDAPDILPIDDQVSDQDQVAGPIPFTVIDADDTNLSFVVTSTNQDLVRDEDITIDGSGADRTITLIPQYLAYGNTTISITVSDPAGLKDTESFLLTVNLVNQPPMITPIDDQTTDEDVVLGPLDFVINDGESLESDLIVTATSSNQAVIADSGLVLGGASANRSLTLTPVLDASGDTEITITVTDEGGLTTTESFTVTVNPVNDAPQVAADGDQTMDEDGTLEVPLTLSDPDDLLDDLVVEAFSSNGAVVDATSLTLSGSGANRLLTITPLGNAFGETTITVTVRDPSSDEGSTDFTLTVDPVNDAPQAVDTIEDGSVLGFQAISLPVPDPLFEDIDGDNLTYELTLADGSPVDWLTFDDQRIFGRPSNTNVGVQQLKVTATDPSGATAEAPFQIEVLQNDFPWHNFRDSTDINDDHVLDTRDVAFQLSYLIVNEAGPLPATGPNLAALRFVDTNRNNVLTTQDLSLTVAALFRQSEGEGEGEAKDLISLQIARATTQQVEADLAIDHVLSDDESDDLLPPSRQRSYDSLRDIVQRFDERDEATRLRDLAIELSSWWKQL